MSQSASPEALTAAEIIATYLHEEVADMAAAKAFGDENRAEFRLIHDGQAYAVVVESLRYP